MRLWWIFYCLILICVSGITANLLRTQINSNIHNAALDSPLPEFLSVNSNRQVSSLNLFLPHILNAFADESKIPDLSAESVLVYDVSTNHTLFSKNPNKRLPMASLTKIMTAVVAIENKKTSNQYVVTKDNLVGENAMGVEEKEELTLEDLLYGLVLVSGNDAAEVLASNYPRGRSRFIQGMNDKAKSLGLKDTNFTNPSGLQGDGDQFTTAYDLFVVTNYALKNLPLFKEVSATYEHHIPASNTHKAFDLYNETNLLTTYPGVKGVKTGYTPEAGLCLVTYLEYEGHDIIAVLLHSENRRQEMKELLDYSLKSIGITPPKHG